MRIKKNEIEAIKNVANVVFGPGTIVQLFGSRVNDSLKGGDIDLLIHSNHQLSSTEQYRFKIKFLVQLKKAIGDQKIDVLLKGKHNQIFIETIEEENIITL